MPPKSLELNFGPLYTAPLHSLSEGATLLRGFAVDDGERLLASVNAVAAGAPFRQMVTPGGRAMSVSMTNCGRAGWVTDRTGYRYECTDPDTERPWPTMPSVFAELAMSAAAMAGFPSFAPDACLINRYEPGARLTLHQDRNELDFAQPIVSVSLGLPATFLWGGQARTACVQRMVLRHGDVVVWGGPARMTFHGIDTLKNGVHGLTGAARFNLTFRRAF